MFLPKATAVAPYNWPMFTDPAWAAKTSDFYVITAAPNPTTYPQYIPSVYMLSTVQYDLTFEAPPPMEDGTAYTIKSVTLSSAPTGESGITTTQKDGVTVTVQGMIQSADGERFDFKMRNNSVVSLPPFNDQDWIAVVKWQTPPQPWNRLNQFQFTIVYDVAGPVPLTNQVIVEPVLQYAYWNWQPSLSALKTLVSQGEV